MCAPIFKNVAERLIEADMKLVPKEYRIEREDMFMNKIALNNPVPEKTDEDLLILNVPDESEQTGENKKEAETRTTVPNLIDMSRREAVSVASNLGIKYKVYGTGNVVSQSINAGEPIKEGALLILRCKPTKKLKGLRIN